MLVAYAKASPETVPPMRSPPLMHRRRLLTRALSWARPALLPAARPQLAQLIAGCETGELLAVMEEHGHPFDATHSSVALARGDGLGLGSLASSDASGPVRSGEGAHVGARSVPVSCRLRGLHSLLLLQSPRI
jgi:hypothetical protein